MGYMDLIMNEVKIMKLMKHSSLTFQRESIKYNSKWYCNEPLVSSEQGSYSSSGPTGVSQGRKRGKAYLFH